VKYDKQCFVEVNSSDSVLISGYSYSSGDGDGDDDMLLVNYNSFGKQLWNRSWDGNLLFLIRYSKFYLFSNVVNTLL